MARHRKFTLSRLQTAWLALISTLIIGTVAVWFMPAPEEEPDLVIALPEEADRFARAPSEEEGPLLDDTDTDVPATETANPAEVADTSISGPNVAGGEDAQLEPLVEAMPGTTKEELPSGALRIIIPSSEGSSSHRSVAPPKAPLKALMTEGEHGIVPSRASDGRTPFEVYRRRPSHSGNGRKVAVLVSGLGIDRELTELAIETLPPDVSFSFAPYSRGVADLMAKAMADGHEVAIELPMEGRGVSADALGPAALTTGRSHQANQTRLDWLLARAPAYAMATNYFGQTYAEDEDAMALVMAALQAHGLAYIDDTGLGRKAAQDFGVPYARVDVLVTPSSGFTSDNLTRLGGLAAGRPALAKVYASPEAVNAVANWTKGITEAGLDLVPVSAIAVDPQ